MKKQHNKICPKCSKFVPIGQSCECTPKKTKAEKTKSVNGNTAFQKVRNYVVMPRDEGKCMRCYIKLGQLTDAEECHHIYNQQDYKHLRYDPDNLIMLCKPCHRIFSTAKWKDKLDFEWHLMKKLQAKKFQKDPEVFYQ